MRRKWIVWAPFAILGVLLFVAIGGFVVRELWNWLLPGLFATRRLAGVHAFAAQKAGTDPDTAAEASRNRIPARRFGAPEEFGAACAFLCSAQAGYITGQSLLLDGGAYPGIL